ncbi:LOW QUALITY PROTEIN: RUS1 family protein C16orf58 homolog [Leucoraja erinacea]|uniref:LOW QUALITY PROTEIN: RUS1 family protein C16orf58 homolog n=1 Tax=Leucoraja erinaceus TaxID=7782 RepID=UPI00245464DA|nr:LOW QUALITY PROTEIN: RUS1 family protein C16orf58 homolog [Leucoraja erinacea]
MRVTWRGGTANVEREDTGPTMAVPAAPTLCSERFGSGPPRLYVGVAGGRLVGQHEDTGRMSSSLSSTLSSVFLPQGYPDSVSADYLPYQLWDTVQAFASTITGALATQAVLKGVGVGDGSASVAAASLTWMLKDGTGMIGRILFAWMKGTHLDRDAKQWRLFADLLNDIAIFIEIVAPFFPAIFTLVVCISCIFKAVVGVSGGATRAALTSHQARRDNMADVSAKDGSQETLVNLAGLCTGLLLTPLAADSTLLTYLLFFLFTSLHLYANVRAVRSVVMETVNRGRLRILLEDFLREGTVPSPPSVNSREPLLPVLWERERLILGAPLHRVVGSTYELKKATENNTKNYLLGVHKKKGEVCVSLREGDREASMCYKLRSMRNYCS